MTFFREHNNAAAHRKVCRRASPAHPLSMRIFFRSAQTACMKLTTILLCTVLIVYGLGACLYALTGIDVLALVSAGNTVVYRSFLSLAGVAALWLFFWLIAFRPTRELR